MFHESCSDGQCPPRIQKTAYMKPMHLGLKEQCVRELEAVQSLSLSFQIDIPNTSDHHVYIIVPTQFSFSILGRTLPTSHPTTDDFTTQWTKENRANVWWHPYDIGNVSATGYCDNPSSLKEEKARKFSSVKWRQNK
ncbi:hypothetical protein YC2023_019545 [Brassica napus]